MKSHLILQVPKQQDFENPAVELDPKKLESWLGQLPLLNPESTARQLLVSIEPFNRRPMPVNNRFELAELYRETLVRIFPSTEDTSYAKNTREILTENMGKLCHEMADSFKIIVKQCYREKQTPEKSSLMLQSAFRAMEMLSLELLHSFRTYYPAPIFTYLEINQLYYLAEGNQVLDTPVKFERSQTGPSSIGLLYKMIMSLSASDPFHLDKGLALKLYEYLEQYAGHCLVKPVDLDDDSIKREEEYLFTDLEGDSPPTPIHKHSSDFEIENPRIIDIRPMMEAIQKRKVELEDLKTSTATKELETGLIRLLLPLSEQPKERQRPRKTITRPVRIAFGIEAAHNLLLVDDARLAKIKTKGSKTYSLDPEDPLSPVLEPWAIINESINGHMLVSKTPPEADIHVGDVISIIDKPDKQSRKQLFTTLVRWLKHGEDKCVEIGTEIVPGDILPLKCRLAENADTATDANSTSNDNDIQHGLFISSVSALKIPATVLFPKKLYQRNLEYEVIVGEHRIIIKAGFLSQDSSYFDRFVFSTINRSEQ